MHIAFRCGSVHDGGGGEVDHGSAGNAAFGGPVADPPVRGGARIQLAHDIVERIHHVDNLTVYAQATANFTYYFQILALLGFIRTGVGAPIGDAIYGTALAGLMNLRPDLELAVRELYGYSVIFGVFVLALIVASRFKRQIYSSVPLIQSIYVAALRKWNIPSFARRKGE